MSKVQIFFIYANDCEHCRHAKQTIESAMEQSKRPCELKEFEFSNKVAIQIALKNGIDDLPGFVVGGSKGQMFKGDDYSEERIIKAIEEYGK